MKKVLIIGGGMSGLAAGIQLQEKGFACVILEANNEPGGLAGFFDIQEKSYPLGYHHILYQDKPLHQMLKKMDLYKKVQWKKGRVLFAIENRIYNLMNPLDFLSFPMRWLDKLRFIKLMAYCFLKGRWDNVSENAKTWLDRIAGSRVREIIFDPLMDIKYGLGSEHLSASWIGSRLHYQEFSKPLGFFPGEDWTKVLVKKMVARFQELGGQLITGAAVKKVEIQNNSFVGLTYNKNSEEETVLGDALINTAPPHIFLSFCAYRDPKLEKISYLDALSLILETEQKLPRELYMLPCLSPRYSFGAIFTLSSLNSSIGTKGGTVLNFLTTLTPKYEHLRKNSSAELLEIYQTDFQKLFGFKLNPLWHHLTLIKNYSPRFLHNYENPGQRGNVRGVYFAGNYLTHPEITSTGSAIASGEKVAEYIAEDYS